ncbi:hypothetical protein D9758_004573 [Tetrapyrgos nigripes]|uniref:RTA1-domain-containing protein n=1 Tax=Tetrapyrgos nigripes TaxID=182062 RepID=A0A8H5LYP6_9AGAR|nr:hypothetical protein D9758_004573 [Tetrapyrgos nigripes]
MFDTYSQILSSRADGNSTDSDLLPESPYGYTPNRALSYIFLGAFLIAAVLHLGQAVFSRRWFLLYTVVLSGILEVFGWYGRLWSSREVLKSTPYTIQFVCTVIAPTPLLAANFVIFGRIIRRLGTTYSRLRPRLYTKIFFTSDVIGLFVQAGGGVIASGTNKPKKTVDLGLNIMLAGIIFQMMIIVSFSLLSYKFFQHHSQDKSVRPLGQGETPRGRIEGKIQLLIYALAFNTVLLFLRAIYRTAELADGFGPGKIISIEWLFLVFDALMVLLATVTYNVFHVGRLMESEEVFMLKLKGSNTFNPSSSDVALNGMKLQYA